MFKSPRFYGQNHHITVVSLGKSPSPHLIKITKLPRILDQNRPITRYFWIQSPNTKNTRPPPFDKASLLNLLQSIVVARHWRQQRCLASSTTMLYIVNKASLLLKSTGHITPAIVSTEAFKST